jgi:hypothetical protein
MSQYSSRDRHMRLRLAQEAARIMVETGNQDFLMAKRKAAAHLSATDTRQLPSNQEIELALREYLRLFRSTTQPRALQKLRETALTAMQFFRAYDPRLVGPVLHGTADTNTPVTLHVFTDTSEDISFELLEHQIPFETLDKHLRLPADEYADFPGFRFVANEIQVEVVVFPLSRHLPAPLSPVDGKPMQRANMATLQELLGNSDK